MKENIKIALLAVIAVTLVGQVIMQNTKTDNTPVRPASATVASTAHDEHEGHNHDNPFDPVQVSEVNTGPVTAVAFAQSSYDFGKIKQDTQNKYKFKFTNTGSNPLIIENASGSCGCTVPEYPKEPIAPGATGEITVEYSPGKQQGAQTKTVTITANTEPRTTQLTITANVEEVN
jgi:hypothetical protein